MNIEESQLLETDTKALVQTIAGGDMVMWSEDKKKEFVGTFQDRVQVARCILERTGHDIAQSALRKKFIGQRHFDQIFLREAYGNYEFDHLRFVRLTPEQAAVPSYQRQSLKLLVGGREPNDLYNIASQRAADVLKNLPTLQKAVQIIDPDTAKMLDRIEVLKVLGEKLHGEVEEASEPILMAEMDQKMTIGEFRKYVKDRDLARRKLLTRIHEVGVEGSQLEAVVGKRLYKGLPGLAEAVVAVVIQHMERSKALDIMGRRVQEQVMFGDNDAAIDLLAHFEKDETEISGSVKEQFDLALEKLKISVKKGRVTAKTLRGKDEGK